MKLSVVLGAVGLLGREVVAAGCDSVALREIPPCAQSCLTVGATAMGCLPWDFGCQCEQEAGIMAAIEECVATGCPSADYQAVIDGVASVCSCASNIFVIQGRGASAGSSFASYAPSSYYASSGSVTATVSNYLTTTTAPTTTAASTSATAGAANLRAALGLVGGVAAAALLL